MIAPALRPAGPADSAQVLGWNGAAEVRARSLDPRPIDPADHARWFAARLADPACALWIVEVAGAPAGVVRVDGLPDAARISIAVDPAWRGRGVGRAAIALACRAAGVPVVAEIRLDNHASVAAFAAAGFTRWPVGDRADAVAYRWEVP